MQKSVVVGLERNDMQNTKFPLVTSLVVSDISELQQSVDQLLIIHYKIIRRLDFDAALILLRDIFKLLLD